MTDPTTTHYNVGQCERSQPLWRQQLPLLMAMNCPGLIFSLRIWSAPPSPFPQHFRPAYLPPHLDKGLNLWHKVKDIRRAAKWQSARAPSYLFSVNISLRFSALLLLVQLYLLLWIYFFPLHLCRNMYTHATSYICQIEHLKNSCPSPCQDQNYGLLKKKQYLSSYQIYINQRYRQKLFRQKLFESDRYKKIRHVICMVP